MKIFQIVTLLLTNSSADAKPESNAMTKVLNDMSEFYGEGSFDQAYIDKLYKCFSHDDDLLMESQENAWAEILQYWKTNGTKKDLLTGHLDTWDDGKLRGTWNVRHTPGYFGSEKMKVY